MVVSRGGAVRYQKLSPWTAARSLAKRQLRKIEIGHSHRGILEIEICKRSHRSRGFSRRVHLMFPRSCETAQLPRRIVTEVFSQHSTARSLLTAREDCTDEAIIRESKRLAARHRGHWNCGLRNPARRPPLKAVQARWLGHSPVVLRNVYPREMAAASSDLEDRTLTEPDCLTQKGDSALLTISPIFLAAMLRRARARRDDRCGCTASRKSGRRSAG